MTSFSPYFQSLNVIKIVRLSPCNKWLSWCDRNIVRS